MRKIYKEVKSICGGTFVYQVCVPSSAKDEKVLKTKYANMDSYDTIRISRCNEREKSLIITAFVLHHLDGEVLFDDGGFTTPTDFRVVMDIEYDDVYIETDDAGWLVGLDRTPSNETFFLADYINRPRKLRRVLEQYPYDERRRWKKIIEYYRNWVKQPDSIVIR